MMIFLLLGVSPNSDVLAHLGGFMSGLALGALLHLSAAVVESTAANLLAVAGLTGLILWTWALAFAHRAGGM
jgi:hypothetical protein